jgi:hypothetical protein
MSDARPKPWRSRVKEFPWLEERHKLAEILEARVKRGEYSLDQNGLRLVMRKVAVDDVLKYARVARNQAEIWAAVQGIVERSKADPRAELTYDENFFFSDFRNWYLLKHDLPYSDMPFMIVDGLLLKIAHGLLPDNLSDPKVRAFLLSDPSVYEAN